MAELAYPKQLKSVHEYFLKTLAEVESRGFLSKHLSYDETQGILNFQEEVIKINGRKVPNNSHYLLVYLFNHAPFEQHFYDELQEEKVLLEERSWMSYYRACLDIKEKVAEVTGVEDLLDFSTGKGMYVRFNPKYSLKENT